MPQQQNLTTICNLTKFVKQAYIYVHEKEIVIMDLDILYFDTWYSSVATSKLLKYIIVMSWHLILVLQQV